MFQIFLESLACFFSHIPQDTSQTTQKKSKLKNLSSQKGRKYVKLIVDGEKKFIQVGCCDIQDEDVRRSKKKTRNYHKRNSRHAYKHCH
ncbi:CLUMA_CG019649, isoform A [Clunio marinus]|uniref:CLUMA_CG019649, isoform A n=1 Tax=Clunio marinus TaxID=568069 RepID=A0A1J1J2V9_9DIPT|nr:CLUMA_CG019649, isoform A [Clunio marinus]